MLQNNNLNKRKNNKMIITIKSRKKQKRQANQIILKYI